MLRLLASLLEKLAPLAVAYSGGLDSRFLAHVADCAGLKNSLRLFHIQGPHVPPDETREAELWARQRDFALTVLQVNPLVEPEVRSGSRERCYFCKRCLFREVYRALEGQAHTVCDGSNLSDQQVYRPGLRALQELGVRSPLTEAGLTKKDIQRLARATGLDRADQQARPCLLTRFAYGLAPTAEALTARADAEQTIGTLLSRGVATPRNARPPDFRLRLVGPAPFAPLPFLTEVHVNTALPATLQTEIGEVVLAHGFPRPRFMVMETISGHYDRLQ